MRPECVLAEWCSFLLSIIPLHNTTATLATAKIEVTSWCRGLTGVCICFLFSLFFFSYLLEELACNG